MPIFALIPLFPPGALFFRKSPTPPSPSADPDRRFKEVVPVRFLSLSPTLRDFSFLPFWNFFPAIQALSTANSGLFCLTSAVDEFHARRLGFFEAGPAAPPSGPPPFARPPQVLFADGAEWIVRRPHLPSVCSFLSLKIPVLLTILTRKFYTLKLQSPNDLDLVNTLHRGSGELYPTPILILSSLSLPPFIFVRIIVMSRVPRLHFFLRGASSYAFSSDFVFVGWFVASSHPPQPPGPPPFSSRASTPLPHKPVPGLDAFSLILISQNYPFVSRLIFPSIYP